jgi:hypothetical protein
MDIEDEMQMLIEMKRLCKLYIDTRAELTPQHRSENPVIINAIKMLASVNQRISHFCSHIIDEDMIEVGGIIKRVRYCNICETNFTS